MQYIVFCGKQNILLRGHPNEKWTKQQFLASGVQVMVLELCCLTRKQDLQGIPLLCLKFQAQADDAALLRNFHCNTYKRGKQVKHLSPKIQNVLTDRWKKALALGSSGGCKSSITKNIIMCLFHCLASTLPHSFRVSVSLLSEVLPTNLSNSALSVSCAPSTDVSGYAAESLINVISWLVISPLPTKVYNVHFCFAMFFLDRWFEVN